MTEIFKVYPSGHERPEVNWKGDAQELEEMDWKLIFEYTEFSPDSSLEARTLKKEWDGFAEGTPIVLNHTTGQFAIMRPPPEISGAVIIGNLQEVAERFGLDAEAIKAQVTEQATRVMTDRVVNTAQQHFVRLSAEQIHQALHRIARLVTAATLQLLHPDMAPERICDVLPPRASEHSQHYIDTVDKVIHSFLEQLGAEYVGDYDEEARTLTKDMNLEERQN